MDYEQRFYDLLSENENLKYEIESLKEVEKQRDDLLAFVGEWLSRQGTDVNYMVLKARAAIASVKGDQS